MGKMEILTPIKSKPVNRLTHNLSELITSTRGTLFGINPFTGDFWANGWNITFCVTVFIYLFFLGPT